MQTMDIVETPQIDTGVTRCMKEMKNAHRAEQGIHKSSLTNLQ